MQCGLHGGHQVHSSQIESYSSYFDLPTAIKFLTEKTNRQQCDSHAGNYALHVKKGRKGGWLLKLILKRCVIGSSGPFLKRRWKTCSYQMD